MVQLNVLKFSNFYYNHYFIFLSSLVSLFSFTFSSSSVSSSYSSLSYDPLSSSSSSLSSSLTSSSSNGWNLSTTINPNCDDYQSCTRLTSKPDVIYTQSSDAKNSIHFITSTLGGFPGLLITRTESPEALKINWDSLLGDCKGSFDFSVLPQDSIGILLLSFFDFDHKDIHWTLGNNSHANCDSSKCSFNYNADSIEKNEIISIGLNIANVQSSFKDFPHLQFTPSSMHIDLEMFNLDKSRIGPQAGGIKLLIVTSGKIFTEKLDQSIDDEHSPGIFTKRSFIFSKQNSTSSTSYIQWKPIAYKSKERVMSKTLAIDSSTLTQTDLPKFNLPLYCFYQQSTVDLSVNLLNVSFIEDSDSSDQKIDLIAWTLVFGLNSPAEDKLSLFIQLMIFVGVGLSLIVMFISLTYVAIKKWQKSRAQRESGLINEVFLDY